MSARLLLINIPLSHSRSDTHTVYDVAAHCNKKRTNLTIIQKDIIGRTALNAGNTAGEENSDTDNQIENKNNRTKEKDKMKKDKKYSFESIKEDKEDKKDKDKIKSIFPGRMLDNKTKKRY
jgi:hypothetical protein